MTPTPHDQAEQALAALRTAGFDAAQVTLATTDLTELNVTNNEPSLLRSLRTRRLALLGIAGGRKAATELSDPDATSVLQAAHALFADARAAPADDANIVSAGQRLRVTRGPLDCDTDLLADAVRQLLDLRASATPRVRVSEGHAAHQRTDQLMLTSGGSELAASVGSHSLFALATARDGARSSSFNVAGGSTDDLAARPAGEHFGIGAMLADTDRQLHPQPFAAPFTGDVVLTPQALDSLLDWLLRQVSDGALLSGTSVYRERVGSAIAAPLLALRSRFDGPGLMALSADACVAAPVELVRDGTLTTLLPSLYGSQRTGLPHVPTAANGWEVAAGQTALADLLGGVQHGALVGRLSMGLPAANGDFAGVVKNSFALVDGAAGEALTETMVAGNVATMLRDVLAVSRERIDTGARLLPWVRIGGLHFS